MGFWNWLFGTGSSASRSGRYQQPSGAGRSSGSQSSQMNEGDYHSGPEGYSPNTPYPETQYGSGFDEDAAWHEGEN